MNGAPVLPLSREGGYWLFSAGEQRFVRRAEIIPFPRREKIRFVSRRSDQIEAILDEIDSYSGERP
ncbi:hypothetical protein LB572_03130 [Mesorhizobium sp. BH1-1-5]|uniref:hypothetical protein n=1 Tax=Mesorhizobium sp. BH1-1-5 TaxID=2876661 RepID=UPI001CCDDEC8|nr:hypothetical protein [Mesorhizobium sp. BH1-1-5]MBZ9986086.1 hypothetical protein [Mesorhizobium sp. BH1-1-5]